MGLYFLLVLLGTVIAYKAQGRKSFLIMCIAIPSLVSGLRDYAVGTDTRAYLRMFQAIVTSPQSRMEIGFVFVSRLLMQLFADPRWLFIIYSFVIA